MAIVCSRVKRGAPLLANSGLECYASLLALCALHCTARVGIMVLACDDPRDIGQWIRSVLVDYRDCILICYRENYCELIIILQCYIYSPIFFVSILMMDYYRA